jgi:hypothetical protein
MGIGEFSRELRLAFLSAASVVVAPFVFVSIIVGRKVALRVHHHARFWNKRLQREIARWT